MGRSGKMAVVAGGRLRQGRDAVNDENWSIVRQLCLASNKGDVGQFNAALDELAALGKRGLPTLYYMSYILDVTIRTRLGHTPSESDLRALALDQDARFARTIAGHLGRWDRLTILEGTYRRLYDYPFDESVEGIRWLIYLSAATGCLLEHPKRELARHRPKLSAYLLARLPEIAAMA